MGSGIAISEGVKQAFASEVEGIWLSGNFQPFAGCCMLEFNGFRRRGQDRSTCGATVFHLVTDLDRAASWPFGLIRQG